MINQDYLQLLDLTYQVAQSLNGKPAPDHRLRDCNKLAAKLFFHAATIYWLRQGTKAPVPGPEGAFFYDLASVAVITRAALETYLTMFELFFEPITDDEREFRHALWLLSGFVIREDHVPYDPTLKDRVANSQREIEEMRARIQSTTTFASLTDRQKRNALKGKRPGKDFKERARAAGFGPESIRRMYQYFSGYVHSDGLSAAQIIQAETKDAQIEYIEGSMHLVMIVMSKMILEYKKIFPSAEAWCLAKPKALILAEVWSEAARRLE